MVNWQQTAKITEVANRLGSKRCEKYRVAKGPIIGRERTTREKSRSRKVHKSLRTRKRKSTFGFAGNATKSKEVKFYKYT